MASPRPSGMPGDWQDDSSSVDSAAENIPAIRRRRPQKPQKRADKKYQARTCRICLEEIQPTEEGLDPFSRVVFKSRVRYISEDPSLDPLISPCLCKGSQKYVHAGCLQEWRYTQPSTEQYWQCPTCKFKYRLKRLSYARVVTYAGIRIALTLGFFLLATFLLGFIGDTFIGLWVDPFGTFWDAVYEGSEGHLEWRGEDEPSSWSYHFLRGLVSFGVLGLAKTFYLSGWRVLYYGGGGAARRRGTGRNRLEAVNWTLVFIGACTFLYQTWKWVSVVVTRVLKDVAEQVLDIQEQSDEDEPSE
ncbi:hypothetical protein OQA88_11386 [Cercophora sp. LCS_1]